MRRIQIFWNMELIFISELYGVSYEKLDSIDQLEEILTLGIEESKAKCLGIVTEKFNLTVFLCWYYGANRMYRCTPTRSTMHFILILLDVEHYVIQE